MIRHGFDFSFGLLLLLRLIFLFSSLLRIVVFFPEKRKKRRQNRLLPVLPLEIHVAVFSSVQSNLSDCIIKAWPMNVLANSIATRCIFVRQIVSLCSSGGSWILMLGIFGALLFDFKTRTILLALFHLGGGGVFGVCCSCRSKCVHSMQMKPNNTNA